MNKIYNFSINKIYSNNFVISKKEFSWEEIKKNLDLFHYEITDIILNEESLYYYCTNNNDSKNLLTTLSDKQKERIKNIFELLIKKPESFYKEYKKSENLLNELYSLKTYEELERFTKKYGIKHKFRMKKISNEINNIAKKIKKESAYGLFGEILFYTVVQHIMSEKDMLISKLSFISAPGTYSHGSDGIFINKKKKVLYFGEAKFTNDLKSSFEQSLNSLKDIKERLLTDKNFVLCHESDMKNSYSLELFEKKDYDKYEKCILIFALNGKEYETKELTEILRAYELKFKTILRDNISFEILVFPILDKEKLKAKISEQVSIKYENNR